MIARFVNRGRELEFLERAYRSPVPQLLVIYGRRRIGKTELVLRFLRDKPHIYYLADLESGLSQLKRFKRSAEVLLQDETFRRAEFRDWEDLFVALLDRWGSERRLIIAIDEFPNLVRVNPAFPSILQRVWDLYLSKADMMLILTGSSVSVMEDEVLSSKSPLYGRRTGQWKLGPISPEYLGEFLPYKEEDLARTYGVTGGVPHYLNLFDPSLPFWDNVERLALSKGGFLYEEADFLLREELRDPSNYKSILEALARGATRLGEVRNLTGLDRGLVSKYLSVLERLDVVAGERPYGSCPKSRRKRYRIRDPYMRFYFRYIQPNKWMIESGLGSELRREVEADYDNFMGPTMEEICREVLPHRFSARRIEKWWGGEGDLDLIMRGAKTVVVECKWGTARVRNEVRMMRRLTSIVGIRADLYVIVARRFEGRPESGVRLISLRELLSPPKL
ncbi:MAG: ATP-binding protein [Candidatus Korarchaeota archaeon]|nr:ATP-binding protein [Candidatus Korarchaeota archaeon]